MASDVRISDARANAALNALFGTAANSGILRIYVGALSAGTPAAPAGALLAELTMNAAAFGAAAPSISFSRITAAAIADDSSANFSGDAGCFVLWDSAGTTAPMAGTAGEALDSADMTLDNKYIEGGSPVSCSAFYVQVPKGWST